MINSILNYAENNKEGFTVNLNGLTPVSSGIAVAYEATQNSFGIDGLRAALAHAKENGNVLGGWFNSEDGMFYWDSVKIFKNSKRAIKFGKKQKQIAIFDITNLEEIRL